MCVSVTLYVRVCYGRRCAAEGATARASQDAAGGECSFAGMHPFPPSRCHYCSPSQLPHACENLTSLASYGDTYKNRVTDHSVQPLLSMLTIISIICHLSCSSEPLPLLQGCSCTQFHRLTAECCCLRAGYPAGFEGGHQQQGELRTVAAAPSPSFSQS